MSKIKLTEIQQDVLDRIPMGRERRITRKRLASTTGYTDRDIRDAIASMRMSGIPIMSTSSSDCSGYWIPTSDEMAGDAAIFLAESHSRMRRIAQATTWASEAIHENFSEYTLE